MLCPVRRQYTISRVIVLIVIILTKFINCYEQFKKRQTANRKKKNQCNFKCLTFKPLKFLTVSHFVATAWSFCRFTSAFWKLFRTISIFRCWKHSSSFPMTITVRNTKVTKLKISMKKNSSSVCTVFLTSRQKQTQAADLFNLNARLLLNILLGEFFNNILNRQYWKWR